MESVFLLPREPTDLHDYIGWAVVNVSSVFAVKLHFRVQKGDDDDDSVYNLLGKPMTVSIVSTLQNNLFVLIKYIINDSFIKLISMHLKVE